MRVFPLNLSSFKNIDILTKIIHSIPLTLCLNSKLGEKKKGREGKGNEGKRREGKLTLFI